MELERTGGPLLARPPRPPTVAMATKPLKTQSLAPRMRTPLNGCAPLLQQQPPWEELIRQQAEVGQLRKKLQQQRHLRMAAAAMATANGAPRMRQSQPSPSTNMAAYLLCLTAGGGVPLFTRKKGDLKALPFPVIGSINGVHMFARTKDVSLLSTCTSSAKVVWQVFHDSIMLIIITGNDQASDSYMQHLLQTIFDTMVLLVGLDDLTRIKNVERLKRDLKCCYRLIDILLDQLDTECNLFGPMTQTVDCVLTSYTQMLQNCLEGFVESTDSTYGCLHIHGRIIVATKKWWSLTERETSLLSLFVSCSPKSTMKDIPVFLPIESPTVPHRLLIFALLPNVEVCVLCGPTPSLSQMEKEVSHYWKNSYDSLKSISQCFPTCFPSNIIFDKNLLGFLLVNTEARKCVCSLYQTEDETQCKGKLKNSRKHQEILRSFYRHVDGNVFQSKNKSLSESCYKVYHTRLKHQALETYLIYDHHKCYAIWSGHHQLFTLFNTQIPTFALRSATQKILITLTKDKHISL